MVSARWPKSTRRTTAPSRRGARSSTPPASCRSPRRWISVLDEETGIPNIMPSVGWGWLNRLPFYLGVAVSVQEITGDYFKRGSHELLRRAPRLRAERAHRPAARRGGRLRPSVARQGRRGRQVQGDRTDAASRQAHQVAAHRRVPDQLRVQGARGDQPGIARPVPGRGGRLLRRRRGQAWPFVGSGPLPHRAGAGRTAAPLSWSSRASSTWSASS